MKASAMIVLMSLLAGLAVTVANLVSDKSEAKVACAAETTGLDDPPEPVVFPALQLGTPPQIAQACAKQMPPLMELELQQEIVRKMPPFTGVSLEKKRELKVWYRCEALPGNSKILGEVFINLVALQVWNPEWTASDEEPEEEPTGVTATFVCSDPDTSYAPRMCTDAEWGAFHPTQFSLSLTQAEEERMIFNDQH